MNSCVYCLLALSALAKLPVHAHVPLPTLAINTARYRVSGIPLRYYLGSLTKTDSAELVACLPGTQAGHRGGNLIFFLPASTGALLGKRQTFGIDVIKKMRVHGRVYETIQHKEESTGVLALRLLSGSIFLITLTKNQGHLAQVTNTWYCMGDGITCCIAGCAVIDQPLRRCGGVALGGHWPRQY